MTGDLDPAELLDVEVEKFPWPHALVANDLGLEVESAQPAGWSWA
ncbi:MAG: hypothetical protein ACJ8H8_21805 [Geminicoccaceae bacterium]